MAENIRKSHRRAPKWPIRYNTTPESTRSWRHNQGESLSRKCSLPCFQMTLILYPNLKTNMELKVFGWDDSPENQGEHLRLLKNGFVFVLVIFVRIHFSWPLQLAGLTGLRPVARLQHGVPQAWRMRMKNGVWLEPVILQMVPPKRSHKCHHVTGRTCFAGSNAGHENWGGSFWRSSCGWKCFEPWWSTVQGLQRQGAGMAWWRESVSVQFCPPLLPQWNCEAERGCRWTWLLMMVPRYWSWACVVPRNCITGKNSKTGKGPKWCVKMERHPKLGDKVKPPTEV